MTGTDDNLAREGNSAQSSAESLTRLIAPIFAVFSLPTIFVYVASDHPGSRWHDVVLSLLLVATGLRGDVPMFWACGVTPQAALARAGLPFAITHAPGHMLITDMADTDAPPGGARI